MDEKRGCSHGDSASQVVEHPRHWEEVEWVEVSCPLCGSDSWSLFKVYRTPEDYQHIFGPGGLRQQVVKCSDCGLVYNNPRPPQEAFLAMSSTDPSSYRPFDVLVERRSEFFRSELALIRKLVPRGRWLDIGCNYGVMMHIVREAGYEVYGNDVQARLIEIARERFELENTMLGELMDLDLPAEHFDVISAYAVLEHVYDPMPLLRESRRLLAPGGVFRCEVPNVESRHARTVDAWWGPYHFTYFSPTTLTTALKEAGFRTLEISANPYVPQAIGRRSGWLYGILGPAVPVLRRLFYFVVGKSAIFSRIMTGSGLYATARCQ